MSTARPFAYNTGSAIEGAEQVGNLAIGYPTAGFEATGLQWWNGPDEDLGYVIAKQVPSGTQPNPLSVPAYVGFSRSTALTEASFVDLANNLTAYAHNFTTGSQAKTWLNANGYWTSYADIWQYDSLTNLTWPSSTSGYTLYNGGFTNSDDGFSNSAISSIDSFEMDNQGPSNQIYISTNGYITLGSGSSNIISTPQSQANPAAICGNPSDNWLQPGLTMTDGDVQNVYYKTGGVSGRSYIKFIVYGGTYGASTTPTSWLLNYYIDAQYQWVETRIKNNVRGNAGPYNASDVSQQASTTSKVWRGDLQGQNWIYMGTGSIVQ